MANHDELLSILQAHGQQFLSSFQGSVEQKIHSGKDTTFVQSRDNIEEEEAEEEEWEGIRSESEAEEGFEENDDEFTATSSSTSTANVIIFSDKPSISQQEHDATTKYQAKAFMSSKISKLREEAAPEKYFSGTTDEDIKERTNIQNDALLHKLVHTKLLSGSLNPELELTPAQRRKALSGRVIELTGDAKLGRGERTVRRAEHNKASKRVREGLMQKQKERRAAQLQETKNLGNYHPALKRLLDPDSETAKPKKRVRGLQMGIGSFKGGTLKLSREEIGSVQGQRGGIASRGRGSGRVKRGRH
ncbi:hypothetical protein EV368DRAFT_79461 [Lentinula lateritia]|uniref:Uncharacterized protein n=1 Tax=Lentinula aff. lateritia TaxID=2804960 RepID=A0ACC1U4P8_9AGAR|nr:hypothetical protein F5876DRAFT_64384 [Lentinula aff. lateritia]KAJ3855670.1 hypothetical protein EV368DRAFT_79461 [Lentinula lateritia]